MYTPTLGEINSAITTNNRKQAASMLQTLLQKKPSADAWYLAAKLTNDRKKKIQYLRTALFLNSKHRKSLNYLYELGEDTGGFQHIVIGGFSNLVNEQLSKSPLLNKLSPRMQRVFGITIFVLLGILVGIFVSSLLSLRGPAILSQGPTTEVIENLTDTKVLNHFYASNLDILFVEQTRNQEIGKDVTNLEIRDIGNRSRIIEIFVYDSVSSILADQHILAIYEQTSNVLAHGNVFLVYPMELSEISANTIIETFETLQ